MIQYGCGSSGYRDYIPACEKQRREEEWKALPFSEMRNSELSLHVSPQVQGKLGHIQPELSSILLVEGKGQEFEYWGAVSTCFPFLWTLPIILIS
jgi:hypothetical protein